MKKAAFPILGEIDRLKADLDALRPLDPEIERRVMDRFRLAWNFHSNALEGNTLSLGETKAFLLEGITAQGKPFKDYLDIKGHDAAIDYLLDFVGHDEPLTEVDIRRLHEILLVEPYDIDAKTPDGQIVKRKVELGRYKRYPNHVETITGKVHYYATPEETPAKMQALMVWYRERTGDMHPVVVAALFHHRFVEIHPFDDGNGRMARLLTNLHLMKHGYPPVIFRKEDRGTYFLALAEADEGAPEDFVKFLAAQLAASIDLYLRGARGEDISELEDFDKRVALLKQRVETSADTRAQMAAARTEMAVRNQIQLYERLIRPLFEKISPHFASVDPLFVKHSSEVEWSNKHGGSTTKALGELRELDLSFLLEAMRVLEVREIKIIEKWEWMRTSELDGRPRGINYKITFLLGEETFWCSHGSLSESTGLFSGPYNSTFSEEEIDQFAVAILNDLYKKLESLSR